MDGIINLDKPAGMSSARAVSRVKRLLPRGTRIGHAGTLDPFATGVLLLLIGKATKRCESLMDQPKSYQTTIKLGAFTQTDDLESPEIPVEGAGIAAPSIQTIRGALQAFVGIVSQRPPKYSAMKIGGRRAYELARRGKEVDIPPRHVRIDAIEIVDFTWPLLQLRIDCGRGTYIRSIARDLGESLKTGGYLTQLRRTRIGLFTGENAITLEQVEKDGPLPHLQPLLPPAELAS